MKKLRIYEYDRCSTCKKAVKFLEQKEIPFERIPIVDRPPSISELEKMLAFKKRDIRKLFNTSGILYRELGLSEKLPKMPEKDAIRLLASHGKLIKRPFLLLDDAGLLGFNEEEWNSLFE